LPATGVFLLAALWGLSAFAGWAAAAFCSDRGLGQECRAHVNAAVRPSAMVAVVAALLAAAALAAARVARSPSAARTLRMRLLTASAGCWAVALAVLFALGEAAGG